MTAAAPSGVVTFLFTDIEGSTRRWEADAGAMRAALSAQVSNGAGSCLRAARTHTQLSGRDWSSD